MKSINTEEVDRLMRVVSEPLRKQWEARNNDGKSLVGLQKARRESDSYIKNSEIQTQNLKKWVLPYSVFMLVCVVIIGRWINSGMGFSLLAILAIFAAAMSTIVSLAILGHSLGKQHKAREVVESCDEVFTRLQKSVHALNPLGLGNVYHDVITAGYVGGQLESLAYRVIDAQVKFDLVRKDKDASRYEIIHLGNFLEGAEDLVIDALDVAVNDFSLSFEKRDVYQKARSRFEKDEKRRATVVAHQA